MSSGFARPTVRSVIVPSIASPSREDPLLIMAMDDRESFGRFLFGVRDDNPGAAQRAR